MPPSVRTLRCPTGRIWLKVCAVGPRIEILVQHGRIRVIVRQPNGPSLVEEDELVELQVEETVQGLRDGG